MDYEGLEDAQKKELMEYLIPMENFEVERLKNPAAMLYIPMEMSRVKGVCDNVQALFQVKHVYLRRRMQAALQPGQMQ